MISHDSAIKMIQEHGIATGWTPTAWFPATGTWDETATFYWALGIQTRYYMTELRQWLGY